MRKREVVFAPEARADLVTIYDHVAEAAGAKTALGYVERIEDFCLGFDLASERGRPRGDIREGLRVVGFERRLAVAFFVDNERVTILRLFTAGRDWEDALS